MKSPAFGTPGRSHRGRSILVAVCLLVVLTPPPLAWAAYSNNILPNGRFSGCYAGTAVQSNTGGPCQTDNASVGYWMEEPIDTTTGSDSEAEIQINRLMAPSSGYGSTDLTAFYDSTPVFSGSGETDIIYRKKTQDFRDSGSVGYYFCNDVAGLSSGNKCDQGYINLRYIQNTPAQQLALACHETGHAVGLLHPTDASPPKSATDTEFECMMNAPIATYPYVGQDPNIANINSVYPN